MTFEQFKNSIENSMPPTGISQYLESLWYDGKGNWEKSHQVIQDIEGSEAAWIHAYLHRKEGDIWNADYWYNRAGRKRPTIPLEKEWDELVRTFL